MNALDAIKKALDRARTENGDRAHRSSGSACLDLFSLCGGMRRNPAGLEKLFVRAYAENEVLAVKILFYLRNIRGGLGERAGFRLLLRRLAVSRPELARKVLYAVPEYGRWDDILVLLDTPAKDDVTSLIKARLDKDMAAIESKKEGGEGSVSLLGKWLPSVNASSRQSLARAKTLMAALGMRAAEYRKLCTALRKEIQIIENNLREKDYSFDYSLQPGQAMLRYKKAFLRNDGGRYKAYLHSLVEQAEELVRGEEISPGGKAKLNAKTLQPYQLVAPFMQAWGGMNELDDEAALPLEAAWLSLERKAVGSRTIVVRDGSGSMYRTGTDSPINVATSLALLFAEQLGGAYRNSFITFSSRPELVQIPESCGTLRKKLEFVAQFNDCSNTDIAKVYELLLSVARSRKVPKEEMIERVLIISDMEFDCCGNGDRSSFDLYRRKFRKAGLELPEIVFWNVAARDAHLPVTMNEAGVKLVSGAGANIFADVVSGDLTPMTPYEFMLKILEPYAEFDALAG